MTASTLWSAKASCRASITRASTAIPSSVARRSSLDSIAGSGLEVIRDEPAAFAGWYRVITLRKADRPAHQ